MTENSPSFAAAPQKTMMSADSSHLSKLVKIISDLTDVDDSICTVFSYTVLSHIGFQCDICSAELIVNTSLDPRLLTAPYQRLGHPPEYTSLMFSLRG